jgi:hypothetical protein
VRIGALTSIDFSMVSIICFSVVGFLQCNSSFA